MKYFVMEFYRIQEKKILKAFLGEEKKEEFFGPCEGWTHDLSGYYCSTSRLIS